MFPDIALHPQLEANLKSLNFTEATEVQQQALPLILEGADLLISSPTGSGKTAAYLIPLIQELAGAKSAARAPRVLLLVPVRELAEQVVQQFDQLAEGLELKAFALVGGEDFKQQEKRLAEADLVVATPGRLLPHLENQSLKLDQLEYLVLDEADRMLETGFRESLDQIVTLCPQERQTLLISATLPTPVRKLAQSLLQDAQWVRIGQQREADENIRQSILLSDDQGHKDKQLCWLLHNESYDKAIVFCNSKTQARRLDGFLRYHKFKAALLHGEVQQKGRFATIEGFRKGTTTVLVTTDLASRGLDVEGVDLVINMEMPRKGDLYLHRIGRTGRGGQTGQAISLIDPAEWNLMSSIERYLKTRFRRKLIDELVGHYKGPKKLKASGKAAGSKKKKKPSTAKKKPLRKAK
ncbi:DEAD/DEAH box helicase [Neptuniibacter halophilus]|uniref:DEAD/DEAH box helicase n=1 Tax=Neptuniibacter halophilus TaxID=651666 RepID=UPI002574148D|nr:DEAD/DEAH box helicase [Neptuniibacter halophilus]